MEALETKILASMGLAEPIFALGAPLRRASGQETWARHQTGTRRRGRACPTTEIRTVPPGRPSSRACSAASPPTTTIRREPTRAGPAPRRRRAGDAGQPAQHAPDARRRCQRAARRHRRGARRRARSRSWSAVFQSSTLSRLPVYSETLDQPRRPGAPEGPGAEVRLRRAERRVRPARAAPAAALCAAVDADRRAAAEDAGGAHPHGAGHRRIRRRGRARHHRGPARADRRRHRRTSTTRTRASSGPARRPASSSPRRAWTSRISRRRPACSSPTPELAEEVDTLGGLVFRLAGRVPARGEVVAHPDGHEFEVARRRRAQDQAAAGAARARRHAARRPRRRNRPGRPA